MNKQKNKIRRRTHINSVTNSHTRTDRIAKRNRVLVARWYYWTECRRLRTDDAIMCLSEEFFVETRTVTNAILDGDAYFRELLDNKATKKDLKGIHNGFNWE